MAAGAVGTGSGAAAGVEALIDRLRQEGAERGRTEAERLLADARAEAERIRAEARADAERLLADARREVEQHRASAQQALDLAVRDTVLALKNRLSERFEEHVRRLVSHELGDRELLGKLILEVAGRAARPVLGEESGEAAEVEVLLPASVVSLDQLRRAPEELSQPELRELVLGVAGGVLRDGVRLATGGGEGLHVRMVGAELELDLSDQTIAAALLEHLRPRYWALLEGLLRG